MKCSQVVWADLASPAQQGTIQCSSHGVGFCAQAHKHCSNLLPKQFYSFHTGVGSQLCIKTAEYCATKTCPEGQFWYTNLSIAKRCSNTNV